MPFEPNVTNGGFPSPNTFAGTASQAQISTIYDLKPQELTQLYFRNAKPKSLPMHLLLKLRGATRGVSNPTTGHYERGKFYDNFIMGSKISGGGAGNAIVVSTTADGMFQSTVASASVYNSYPVVGNIIEFPDGTQARITAKDITTVPSLHRFTLVPLLAADDLDPLIVSGQALFIVGSAYPEGDGLPQGRQARIIKYTNTFQTITTSYEETGSAAATTPYFIDGNMAVLNIPEMYARHDLEKDQTLVFGKQSDNLTASPSSLDYTVPVETSQGMLDFIRSYGFDLDYVPGLLSIQDFDNVSNIFESERTISNVFDVFQGYSAYQEIENVLVDYSGNKVNGATISTGQGDIEIEVGAKSINKGGFTYNFMKMDIFNDSKLAGTSGYDYKNYSVFVPYGDIKDSVMGTIDPLLMYEYRQAANMPQTSRDNFVRNIDGTQMAGGNTNTEFDIRKIGITSEFCLHMGQPNSCAILRPQL